MARATLPSMVSLPRMGRVMRTPQHPFQLRTRPWTINPFFIAPVLPGETMKKLLWQARCVTQPVTNPLIGWWKEYFYFYVKLRDLDARDEFEAMVLDPSWTIANVDATAAAVKHYFYGSGIDWVDHCLKRVCADDCAYFRNEGEAWDVATIDGLPVSTIVGNSVWDSLVSDTDLAVDVDVDVDANADDTITAGEIDAAMRQWQLIVEGGLTDMTFNDYLRTFGVKPKAEEAHIPELVRFTRHWQYPSNTIDPADGSPSSAVSWSIREQGDKDRFFKEPGFLFGVTVTRPKVFLGSQKGSVTSLMSDVFSWLPAIMSDDPRTSFRQGADGATSGPLGDVTDAGGYWFDLKDLLLYGEQFVNFATNTAGANFVPLPTAGLQKRYVTETMTDAFFVSGDSDNGIREDGIVSLMIAGRQQDTSIRT